MPYSVADWYREPILYVYLSLMCCVSCDSEQAGVDKRQWHGWASPIFAMVVKVNHPLAVFKIDIENLVSSVKRSYFYFSTVLYVVLTYCCLRHSLFELPLVSWL